MGIAQLEPVNRDDAPIARPCGADYSTMSPRGTARFCGACDKLVHDLSAMSEREARSLLRARSTEGLCVRYLHDANGDIWFGGRSPGGAAGLVPAARLARHGAAMAAAAALVLTPVLTEACGGAGPDPNPYNHPFESADAASPRGDRSAADPSVASAGDAGSPETEGSQDARVDAATTADGQAVADGGARGAAIDAAETD
jgi:hypothetical protein